MKELHLKTLQIEQQEENLQQQHEQQLTRMIQQQKHKHIRQQEQQIKHKNQQFEHENQQEQENQQNSNNRAKMINTLQNRTKQKWVPRLRPNSEQYEKKPDTRSFRLPTIADRFGDG